MKVHTGIIKYIFEIIILYTKKTLYLRYTNKNKDKTEQKTKDGI